jgi:uncharacterized protein (DUF2384 family)
LRIAAAHRFPNAARQKAGKIERTAADMSDVIDMIGPDAKARDFLAQPLRMLVNGAFVAGRAGTWR